MSLATEWPHTVKSGNASISIYQIENKGCQEFKVVYDDAERKRRFKTCAEFVEAKKFAENVTTTIGNGEISVFTLTNTDRLLYLRAVDSLKGAGIPLDSAVAKFVAAKNRLGARPLKEAVPAARFVRL